MFPVSTYQQASSLTLNHKPPSEGLKCPSIMGQIRYSSLAKEFPSIADKLFDQVEEDARHKYETYKALAQQEQTLF